MKKRGTSVATIVGTGIVAVLLLVSPALAANPHPDKGKDGDHGNKHDEPAAPPAEVTAPPSATESDGTDPSASSEGDGNKESITDPSVSGSTGASSDELLDSEGTDRSRTSKTSKPKKAAGDKHGDDKHGDDPSGVEPSATKGKKKGRSAKSPKASKDNDRKAAKPARNGSARRPASAARGKGHKKGHHKHPGVTSAGGSEEAAAGTVMEEVLGVRFSNSRSARGKTLAAGGGDVALRGDALPYTGGDLAAFAFIGLMVVTVGGLVWRAPNLIDQGERFSG